jgi:hypothetical protein
MIFKPKQETMNFINTILIAFTKCFTANTFRWFVITVTGLMCRTDKLGTTSFIRALSLDERSYDSINNFFKRAEYDIDSVENIWIPQVVQNAQLVKVEDRTVLIGDHSTVIKDARNMPAVKRHHQESENSSKPSSVLGHAWGCFGALAGNEKKQHCIPLSLKIHEGAGIISEWTGKKHRLESKIVQMIEQAHRGSEYFEGPSLLALDRAFFSVPALQKLNTLNVKSKNAPLHSVTKAKSNCVGYKLPGEQPPGKRGPKPVRGEKVKLFELFDLEESNFEQDEIVYYGEKQTLHFLTIDLLWGKDLNQLIRFVLVKDNKGRKAVLVSTDLKLSPVSIIQVYGYRFKIEDCFREMKQSIGVFDYHFWSKSMPKLNRFRKKDDPDPLEEVKGDEERQKKIINTFRAIEMHALCGCIAIGILQMLSIQLGNSDLLKKVRYLRTRSNEIASEATMMAFVRNQLILHLSKKDPLRIIQIIKSKQSSNEITIEPNIGKVA